MLFVRVPGAPAQVKAACAQIGTGIEERKLRAFASLHRSLVLGGFFGGEPGGIERFERAYRDVMERTLSLGVMDDDQFLEVVTICTLRRQEGISFVEQLDTKGKGPSLNWLGFLETLKAPHTEMFEKNTLALENLDLNELESTINALSLGLAENGEELLGFAAK